MRLRCLLLTLVWLACGCTSLKPKYFTYVAEDDAPANRGFPQGATVEECVLDDTYQLYVRAVCRPRPTTKAGEGPRRPNEAASVTRCDCAASANPNTLEQLELQYLFVSLPRQKLVYITGMLPYQIAGESHFNQPLSRLHQLANLSEMNTFFFADLLPGATPRAFHAELWRKGAKIAPSGTNLGREQWHFTADVSGEWLTLERVEQEQVGAIVATEPGSLYSLPIRFHRPAGEWVMGVSRDFGAQTLEQANVARIHPKSIFLVHQDGELDQVAFRVDSDNTRPELKDRIGLYFGGNRVQAHPSFKPRGPQGRPPESGL